MEDVFGNRIVLAEQHYTYRYGIEMKRVLAAIAFFMSDEPDKWLKKVWVSDMSSVSDFAMNEANVKVLGEVLGVSVGEDDYLWKIAKRMHEKEN